MIVGTTIDEVVLLDEAHLLDDEALHHDDHEAHLLWDDETETPEMTEKETTDDDPGLPLVVDEAAEAFHRMAMSVQGRLIELTMPSMRTLGVKLVAMNETNKRKICLLALLDLPIALSENLICNCMHCKVDTVGCVVTFTMCVN